MNRKTIAGVAAVATLFFASYGTLAFYTSSNQVHNVITTGSRPEVNIVEWSDSDKTIPFPEDGVTGVMPGTDVTKIVEITNNGGSAAYIRAKVVKEIELAEGVNGNPNLDLVTMDFNTTDWTYQDGYYYYNEVLLPGEENVSKPLFTTVSFDKELSNLYQNSTASIDVKVEAVQVANNGNSALEAKGWPEG